MGVLLNAARLRHELDLRGWTQLELSQHSGVSQVTISNALAGKLVSRRTARLIAEAFEKYPAVLDGWLKETA